MTRTMPCALALCASLCAGVASAQPSTAAGRALTDADLLRLEGVHHYAWSEETQGGRPVDGLVRVETTATDGGVTVEVAWRLEGTTRGGVARFEVGADGSLRAWSTSTPGGSVTLEVVGDLAQLRPSAPLRGGEDVLPVLPWTETCYAEGPAVWVLARVEGVRGPLEYLAVDGAGWSEEVQRWARREDGGARIEEGGRVVEVDVVEGDVVEVRETQSFPAPADGVAPVQFEARWTRISPEAYEAQLAEFDRAD